MSVKFPFLGGGFWGGGGGSADFIFMGARIFLNIGSTLPWSLDLVPTFRAGCFSKSTVTASLTLQPLLFSISLL